MAGSKSDDTQYIPKFEDAAPIPKFEDSIPLPKKNDPSVLQSIGESLKRSALHFGGVTQAAVNGAAKFASGGLLPVAAGARGAIGGTLQRAINDNTFDIDDVKKDYLNSRDAMDAVFEQSYKKHPVAYGTGAVTGAIVSPINKIALPGMTAARELGGLKGYLAATGLAAGNGALAGGLMDPGNKPGVLDPLQVDERLQNAATGAKWGGAMGGVYNALPSAKKTISSLLGPSEESIDKYVQGRDRINKAPTVAELKDAVDGQLTTLRGDVEQGKLSIDEAKGHFNDLNAQLKEVMRDAGHEYDMAMPALRESVRSARESLNQAQNKVVEGLKGVPHPQTLAPDAYDSVKALKDQVVSESGQARNILENSGLKIATKPVVSVIDDAIEKHLVGGSAPLTESAKASVGRLQQLKETLKQYPEELSGPEGKRLVQQLDEEASYLMDNGGFSDSYSNAIKDVRRAIDEQLKEHGPYREQMAKVSEKAGLLEKANRLFGQEQKAYSSMGSMASPGRVPQREILENLGKNTNQDFSTPLQKYIDAQSTLKNDLPKIFEKLPEREVVKAGEDIQEIAPYLRGDYQKIVAQEKGIPSQLSAKQAELDRLQEALLGAKEKVKPFSAWTQQGSQTKLQSLINRNPDKASIEAQRELEALDGLRNRAGEDPSYLQSIDDMRVLNEFGRSYTQGSRRSQMFRGAGETVAGAVSAIMPHAHGPLKTVLGGTGALVGGVMDTAGGKTAKGMIDLYLDNPETFEVIQNLKQNQTLVPWLQLRKLDRAEQNR